MDIYFYIRLCDGTTVHSTRADARRAARRARISRFYARARGPDRRWILYNQPPLPTPPYINTYTTESHHSSESDLDTVPPYREIREGFTVSSAQSAEQRITRARMPSLYPVPRPFASFYQHASHSSPLAVGPHCLRAAPIASSSATRGAV